jgi:5-amino-6-(5-phospho-D-ribitylamino)uracil phosphatase
MNTNYKLLAFDFDDTLLSSNKQISKENINAIKKASDNGIYIAYITARARENAAPLIEGLPCDCIAYYNGAHIYANNTLIEKNDIPYDQGIDMLLKIQERYPNIKMYIHFEPYRYTNGELVDLHKKESRNCTLNDLPHHDFQRIWLEFDESQTIFIDDLMTDTTNNFLIACGAMIILHKNALKENALIKIADYYNVPMSNVVAFGDDIIDLNMLKEAGVGVAVANALESVKQAADVITETNDNNGIAVWINSNIF